VAFGDDCHLDKGVSQTVPLEEKEVEGKERQRHWIPEKKYQFPIPTGDLAVPRHDPKWDPENDKDE
jgi:hypothetical protein